MEHVLDNDNAATRRVDSWQLRVERFILFLLCLAELADTNADAKLLATLVALEY
jgi:monomeric isocitrate dehydrogenase